MAWRDQHRKSALAAVAVWQFAGGAVPAGAQPLVPEETLTLDELIALPEKDLAQVDIAMMNLACAEGLPGSEGMDRKALLAQLDAWAEYVGRRTVQHLYRFHQDPAEFNHSLADFAMAFMATILQQELGVHYNPNQITPVDDPTGFDFTRSQDLFINGILAGTGGTCTSMPVIYVAIGRRLGYPLKLVSFPGHSIARWDDPVTGERFNIEATSPGFNRTDDEHYEDWIRPLHPVELERGNYLESLTPREELSLFLMARGDNLMATGRLMDAHCAYEAAADLAPRNYTAAFFYEKTDEMIEELKESRIEEERASPLDAAHRRHQRRLRTGPRMVVPGLPAVPTAHPMSVRAVPAFPGLPALPTARAAGMPPQAAAPAWSIRSVHPGFSRRVDERAMMEQLGRPAAYSHIDFPSFHEFGPTGPSERMHVRPPAAQRHHEQLHRMVRDLLHGKIEPVFARPASPETAQEGHGEQP